MKTSRINEFKRFLAKGPIVRFGKNSEGVAALEFALILPLLLGMCFLVFDTTAVMTQSKRATRHYYSLGDIVSSSAGDLTCGDLDKASELVYASYRHSNWARRVRNGDDQFTDNGALDFRFILSVVEAKSQDNGNVRGEVDWVFFRTNGIIQSDKGWRPGRKFNIPDGLQVPGTKFVRVEGRVYTKPLIGYKSDGSQKLKTVIRYFPLRFVNDVGLVEEPGDEYTDKCKG